MTAASPLVDVEETLEVADGFARLGGHSLESAYVLLHAAARHYELAGATDDQEALSDLADAVAILAGLEVS